MKKIITIILTVLVIAIIVSGVSIANIIDVLFFTKAENSELMYKAEEAAYVEYDKNVKQEVELVCEELEKIYGNIENGSIAFDEGIEAAADYVRNARPELGQYFWVDDYEGNCVVLLVNPNIPIRM